MKRLQNRYFSGLDFGGFLARGMTVYALRHLRPGSALGEQTDDNQRPVMAVGSGLRFLP
jgi:hypothetical protein